MALEAVAVGAGEVADAVENEARDRGAAAEAVSSPSGGVLPRQPAVGSIAARHSRQPVVAGVSREMQADVLSRLVAAAILGAETSAFEDQVRQAVAVLESARVPPSGTPLSIAQAAKRLGVSTSRTLMPAIAAKLVATIPWGRSRRRISVEEIERLERDGFGGKKRRSKPAKGLRAKEPQHTETKSRARLSYADALAGK